MSRLSELAVAKRSVTLLLAAALFIAGISAWGTLQQELLPDIDFPVITVVAPLPGASATDVASQVAEPIERAIAGVPRLENLQSTSANSVALVVAQFSFGTDVKETQAAIEDNIASAGLPDSVEPDVSALNINASPVVIASIAATNEDGLEAAADIARTEIIPEILGLEGVASADLTGGLEQQVLVTLDPDKLAETGITVAQISGVFQANDLTLPSGQLSTDGAKVPVSTSGELGSVEAIRDLVVGVKMPAAIPPAAPRPRRRPPPQPPPPPPPTLAHPPTPAHRLTRTRRRRPPSRPLRSPHLPPSRPRSRSATSVPSSPRVSRRPVTRAPMVSRRSPSPSPRRRPRTPSMSPGRSSSRSRMPAPGTPTR